METCALNVSDCIKAHGMYERKVCCLLMNEWHYFIYTSANQTNIHQTSTLPNKYKQRQMLTPPPLPQQTQD